MKIITKMAILAIAIMVSYSIHAQILTSNRQNYFNKYAERLPANVSELEKAFSTEEGGKVKINFGNFSFYGIVTSSVKKYENLQSIVVKSPDLNNTLLAISRRINEDKTISYVGHIINEKYADGFELRKDNDGSYAMNKIKTDALIEDY
ncbi:MAG: hypothetical protein ABI359_00130 [Ginsengibacter sp.]